MREIHGHLGDGNMLQVRAPQVQQQKGAADCGCFAVCFAVSLALGENPTDLLYSQKEMREHLIQCIEQGYFVPFSSSDKKTRGHTYVTHSITF